MQTKLKVLVFDIETAPMLAYVWGRKDQYIPVSSIKNDWYVMAWSAKWLEDAPWKTIYYDQRHAKDIENDKEMLKPLWALLDEADIVITQNGKQFDSKKLNARFMLHGMKPPSPYKHLDTYLLINKVASFSSPSLEYLSDKLCTKYKKVKHLRFPGMSLWKECLKGNKAAWDEMKFYNIRDTLSTEELYMKIRAWTPDSMPDVYYSPDGVQCRKCGSERMKSHGLRYTTTAKYRRRLCLSCGGLQKGEKVV